MRQLLAVTCFVSILVYSMQGVAMSLLFGTDVVLFSPLEGQITYEGKPVENAQIIRLVRWKDKAGKTEVFNADESGYFKIPLMRDKVRIPPLVEFVVHQRLTVVVDEKEYVIWAMGKGSTDLFGELGGKPEGLTCELTDSRERIEVDDGLLVTSCKWEQIVSTEDM